MEQIYCFDNTIMDTFGDLPDSLYQNGALILQVLPQNTSDTSFENYPQPGVSLLENAWQVVPSWLGVAD